MQELNDVYNIQDTYGTEEIIDINTLKQKNIWKILSLISWLLLISSQLNSLEFNLPISMVDNYILQYYEKKNINLYLRLQIFFLKEPF